MSVCFPLGQWKELGVHLLLSEESCELNSTWSLFILFNIKPPNVSEILEIKYLGDSKNRVLSDICIAEYFFPSICKSNLFDISTL